MEHQDVVFVIAGVLAGGVAAHWLGWRVGIPAIVFLLAGGLIAGPLTGALDPDHTFGELLFPAVSVAVAVILFEGAMGLGAKGVRAGGRTVWMLLTVGATITVVGTALAARYILDVDWNMAILLAAVLVVTGPTVIGPIVRSLNLHGRVGSILEAEGTLIDPIGAIGTVLAFQLFFQTQGEEPGIGDIVATFAGGAAIGAAAAAVLVVVLTFYWIPDELHNVFTLALVVCAFAAGNAVQEEAGLVAVTVMGIVVASQPLVSVRHVLGFNETLRIIFISGLFVLLGARIEYETLRNLELQNFLFLLALVLIVRPVAVAASTIGSDLTIKEKVFLGATAPRGIVAAAIASIFSLRLAEVGVEDSQVLVSATFTVIAGTVLLSGLGSKPLAKKLGLTGEGGDTILVLGSNPLSRAFAEALEQHDATVRIVDLDRKELAAARMTGLPTHHGSVLVDSTWEEAGLREAGRFVALTSNDELNSLAARHAAEVVGRKQVFQLPPSRPEHGEWWTKPVGTFARTLFSKDVNYDELVERLNNDWRVVSTRLTEAFGPDDYLSTHPDAVPLFLVDAKKRIHLYATDSARRPKVDDTLVALAAPG